MTKLKDASRLTAEEEFELSRKIKAGDVAARDRLVFANERMVVHVVKRIFFGGNREDVVQEGLRALIEAADTYDPGPLRRRFSTWAIPKIKKAVIAMVNRDSSPLFIGVNAGLIKYRAERLIRSGEAATAAEAIAKVNVDSGRPADFRMSLQFSMRQCRPVNTSIDRSKALPPDEIAIRKEEKALLHLALQVLTPLEYWVIMRRVGAIDTGGRFSSGRMTISKDCGLSIGRIRQVEKTAMTKLRTAMGVA